MAAQRDIDRMIDKYRLHREAQTGEPLTLDDRTRGRLLEVVEEQYGAAGLVSSQEAAEKYAESLAWQKGLGHWWHKLVPWVGFAGVCCLALIVIFVAANHRSDPKQALVTGPDLMESVNSAEATTLKPGKKDLAPADDSNAGSLPAGATEQAKAPPPTPTSAPAPAIVINAPLPDPSAPMEEEPSDVQPALAAAAPAVRTAATSPSNPARDADTTPASALVPVARKSASAKKAPAMLRMSPEPAAEDSDSRKLAPRQVTAPIAFNNPLDAMGDPRPAKTAPRPNRSRESTPVPPPTPIVSSAPVGQSVAFSPAPIVASPRSQSEEVSAPAGTPRLQRFRSAQVLDRRNPNAPPRRTILGQFDLLTSGSRVTIKDADGSIYKGRVTSTRGDRFAFRVSGVNRTSGNRIEFSGNFSPSGSERGRTAAAEATAIEGELKVAGRQPLKLTARRFR